MHFIAGIAQQSGSVGIRIINEITLVTADDQFAIQIHMICLPNQFENSEV